MTTRLTNTGDLELLEFAAEGPDRVENQLQRFALPYRHFIRSLTCCSKRMEDLLFSFPGLGFALATGYGSIAERAEAFELIDAGQSLKAAAEAVKLPWWMRRLPPEAFTEPLRGWTQSAEFARVIVQHIPEERQRAMHWFRRVQLALDLAGEDFALWIAWRTKTAERPRDLNRIVLLGAWAFFSKQKDTLGRRLVSHPFTGGCGFSRAVEAAHVWKKRADLAVALGSGLPDCWYQGREVCGYLFLPLATVEDYLREAEAMGNCLDQYGLRVATGTSRVFSIRKGGRPVANLELGPHDDDPSMPAVEQLRGVHNRQVGPDIWQAVYAFLGSEKPRPLPLIAGPDHSQSLATAKQIWEPFVSQIGSWHSVAVARTFFEGGEVFDPKL